MDRAAMALSGLCLVHCLLSAVLLGLLSAAGSLVAAPIVHEVGLVLAIALGALALGQGARTHGYFMPAAIGGLGLGVMAGALAIGHAGEHGSAEAIWTVIGVAILALGHDLNRRAVV